MLSKDLGISSNNDVVGGVKIASVATWAGTGRAAGSRREELVANRRVRVISLPPRPNYY